MPSPFPGMDPYLEDPSLWPDLHHRLITYTADALQPAIRPRYRARIGERLYVIPALRSMVPDVSVVQRARVPALAGPIALAEPDEPLVFSLPPAEVREGFIEIVDLSQGGQVVTVIEILSPTNKAGDDRELYERKQREVLASQANLVEIDLLRQGSHTVYIPLSELLPYQPWHYLVAISRAARRHEAAVYFLNLQNRLPRIAIPLAADDRDAVLDLQAIFERSYDNGAYAEAIDYSQPPKVPLNHDDAAWADALLREKGLRAAP